MGSGGNGGCWGSGRLGTLLGPEGTAGRLFVQGRYESDPRLWVGCGSGGCGLVPLSQTAGLVHVLCVGGRVGAGVRVPEPVVA